MPSRAFITIPRPMNGKRGLSSGYKRDGSQLWNNAKTQVYLQGPSEREYLQRAADLCGCSLSQFIRQCSLNTAYALGVQRDVPDPDERLVQTASEDSQQDCPQHEPRGD